MIAIESFANFGYLQHDLDSFTVFKISNANTSCSILKYFFQCVGENKCNLGRARLHLI